MAELIEKLGINPLLLIAQIVNFLILLFVLKRFLYKPIITLLDKRTDKIATSLKKAEEIERSVLRTEEAFEKKIVQAGKEATAIITEAKQSAEEIHVEMVAKAESQVREIIDKGKQALVAEREQLRLDLRRETAGLVIKATEHILGEELTPEKKQAYAKKIIERIPS